MDDLISRQAAIKAVRKLYIKEPKINNDYVYNMGIDEADDAIRGLPSAERRGRWIRTEEDGYCSICNCDMPMYKEDWEWRYLETPYCPNCGAKMEGKDHDEE